MDSINKFIAIILLISLKSLSSNAQEQRNGQMLPSYEYLSQKAEECIIMLGIQGSRARESESNNKYFVTLNGNIPLHGDTNISLESITKHLNEIISIPDSIVMVGNLIWIVSLNETGQFEKISLVKNNNPRLAQVCNLCLIERTLEIPDAV
ncbi:MAG: hypothetical protein ABJF11_10425 [Reichenbachiella sp.]|uniref:hypothetical protein n=1 Tax=Reichenbachiella sp. TaxID=2184521 RepID=UPI003266E711